MKVYNHTQDLNIEKASLIFMKHFKDEEFLKRVRLVASFSHADSSGSEVAYYIATAKGSVYLRHVKPKNPFTKMIAHAELPNIYFNSYKQMHWIERVETICHEVMHLLGYSHDGNFATEYNLKTVPYLVAEMFKEYVSELYGKKEKVIVCHRSIKTLWMKQYCYEKEVWKFE